jgi:fused signal recognition particle receptor
MALFDRLWKSKGKAQEAGKDQGNLQPEESETALLDSAEALAVGDAGPSQPDATGALQADTIRENSLAAEAVAVDPPKKVGWFDRLKQGLKKTTQILQTDVRDLFKKEGTLLDDAFLDRLFSILVRTDMGNGPARGIRDKIAEDFRGRVVVMEDLLASIRAQLKALITQAESPIQYAAAGPTVVMIVGVNGSGKTTTIAKLSAMFKANGHSVVLGAGDTFRAAAVEQLTIWSQRLGVDIVTGDQGSDPAAVAHRAVARALETQADVCILDTAGRLQTQTNLMNELTKIRRVVGKLIPEAPHEVLLVLDATAGQNGISQARGFSEAVACTGIVLAKLDGTAKGGVIIPIRQQFGIPVKFIGVGETPADLSVFQSESFVDALFDGLELKS